MLAGWHFLRGMVLVLEIVFVGLFSLLVFVGQCEVFVCLDFVLNLFPLSFCITV